MQYKTGTHSIHGSADLLGMFCTDLLIGGCPVQSGQEKASAAILKEFEYLSHGSFKIAEWRNL